jgi:hypothetical protein
MVNVLGRHYILGEAQYTGEGTIYWGRYNILGEAQYLGTGGGTIYCTGGGTKVLSEAYINTYMIFWDTSACCF